MQHPNGGGRHHRDDGDARGVDQLGGVINSGNSGHIPERQPADPRLVFLVRAAAKLHLIEACYQDVDTAFADLVPAFRQIAVPPCRCEAEILAAFARRDLEIRQQWLRKWWWRRS